MVDRPARKCECSASRGVSNNESIGDGNEYMNENDIESNLREYKIWQTNKFNELKRSLQPRKCFYSLKGWNGIRFEFSITLDRI